MSKQKNKRSNIVSRTKPNGFGIVPEFVFLKTDCFDLVQNLLSWSKYKWFLFIRQIRQRTQTFWLHSIRYRNVLWNVCSLLYWHYYPGDHHTAFLSVFFLLFWSRKVGWTKRHYMGQLEYVDWNFFLEISISFCKLYLIKIFFHFGDKFRGNNPRK
jgi:hypothetical protein